MPANSRQTLRDAMRRRRRAVDAFAAQAAAVALRDRIAATDHYRDATVVAAYLTNDGEIDTDAVIRHAWAQNKTVCLPVVEPRRRLSFCRFQPDTPLRNNRFGIPEPPLGPATLLDPDGIDLVLVPLVAFDRSLHRIGMGGGYYDRTFADSGRSSRDKRLMGTAYEFQRVDSIIPAAWDVPLYCVATETTLHRR